MAQTKITGRLIRDLTITDSDVAAANKDGTPSTPSMRTLGTGAQQACAGNDARLSDDRTASGLRTATTIVDIDSADAPTAGQILVALSGTAAEWQDQVSAVSPDRFVCNEVPSGTVDGTNAVFTLADTPLAGTEKVFVNGTRMKPGATNDYTISGDTITFIGTSIPETGDELLADYIKA